MPRMSYVEELRAVVGSRLLITAGAVVVVLREDRVLLDMRRDSRKWPCPAASRN